MHAFRAGFVYLGAMRTPQSVAALVLACAACGKPPVDEYPLAFVPALAQIIASPTAQKPKTTKDDKTSAVYTYDAVLDASNVVLNVAKDHKVASKLTFESPKKMGPWSFAAKGESTVGDLVGQDWGEIKGGPLKGSAVHVDASGLSAQIYSPAFFLSALASTDGDEARMRRWACEHTSPKVTPSAFLVDCTSKIGSTMHVDSVSSDVKDVLATKECGYFWRSEKNHAKCFFEQKTGTKVEYQ